MFSVVICRGILIVISKFLLFCLPNCKGHKLSGIPVDCPSKRLLASLYWIRKSAAWFPRQLILLFPGAMSFLTDGIFIDNRREDGGFSNYTPSEEPFHSFDQHLLKQKSPWPRDAKKSETWALHGHWHHLKNCFPTPWMTWDFTPESQTPVLCFTSCWPLISTCLPQ